MGHLSYVGMLEAELNPSWDCPTPIIHVGFCVHNGIKSDIKPCPLCAPLLNAVLGLALHPASAIRQKMLETFGGVERSKDNCVWNSAEMPSGARLTAPKPGRLY